MAKASDYLVALDDGHGMETAGKRTPYIASIGRSIKENEFNRAVVALLDKELKRCGFRTLLVAPTDADTPLKTRTDLANSKKANIYVSIHYDAFDSMFNGNDPEGFTIFVYLKNKTMNSGKLANCVLKYLKEGTKQQNRGVKEADFHVLRETKMPAILTECGFMDNQREALLMIDPAFQKEVAVEHAKGICDYFGVAYVPEKVSTPSTPKPTEKEEALMQIKDVLSKSQREDLAKGLKEVRELGILSSADWEKKATDGTMTVAEMAFIGATVANRSHVALSKKCK